MNIVKHGNMSINAGQKTVYIHIEGDETPANAIKEYMKSTYVNYPEVNRVVFEKRVAAKTPSGYNTHRDLSYTYFIQVFDNVAYCYKDTGYSRNGGNKDTDKVYLVGGGTVPFSYLKELRLEARLEQEIASTAYYKRVAELQEARRIAKINFIETATVEELRALLLPLVESIPFSTLPLEVTL